MWNAIWIDGALVAKERPSVLKYFPVNSVQELARTMACCLKELALGGGGGVKQPFPRGLLRPSENADTYIPIHNNSNVTIIK